MNYNLDDCGNLDSRHSDPCSCFLVPTALSAIPLMNQTSYTEMQKHKVKTKDS